MDVSQGAFLGIVQGITEFLPVSSSGHLVLFQKYLNIKEPPVILDSLLHLGTLLAVIIFFRTELWLIVKAVIRRNAADDESRTYRRLAIYLAIGSVPAAILGLTMKNFFERQFESVPAVGVMLLVTGILLWFAERIQVHDSEARDVTKIRLTDGLWIGLAQSMAIMPGLSRSGATITSGLWRGLDRPTAARFSFLLSIPAVLGASGLSLFEARNLGGINMALVLFSTGVAFIVGLAAIAVMLYLIEKRRLRFFSVYCFIAGSAALGMYYF